MHGQWVLLKCSSTHLVSSGLVSSQCGSTHRHPEKGEALGKLFERLHVSLQDTGEFPAVQGGDAIPAKPEAKVWTMFQLASHYDMQGRTGERLFWLSQGRQCCSSQCGATS